MPLCGTEPPMVDISDHALDKLRPNGKSRQVRIRVEPMEREAFDRAAKMSGLNLSAWMRLAAREMAGRQFSNSGVEVPWVT